MCVCGVKNSLSAPHRKPLYRVTTYTHTWSIVVVPGTGYTHMCPWDAHTPAAISKMAAPQPSLLKAESDIREMSLMSNFLSRRESGETAAAAVAANAVIRKLLLLLLLSLLLLRHFLFVFERLPLYGSLSLSLSRPSLCQKVTAATWRENPPSFSLFPSLPSARHARLLTRPLPQKCPPKDRSPKAF